MLFSGGKTSKKKHRAVLNLGGAKSTAQKRVSPQTLKDSIAFIERFKKERVGTTYF
jgi:hypothetical protein